MFKDVYITDGFINGEKFNKYKFNKMSNYIEILFYFNEKLIGTITYLEAEFKSTKKTGTD